MAQKLVSNIQQARNANIVTEKLSTCSSALDDLKDTYDNKFLSDVNLKTKTNLFPAHKIVLCARSPVFKAMFSNDMREKNSDSIQVDDLEDDTVQQLLLFLYSDTVEDLQWETASKLYYAGDKYQIEKLKLICSSFLISNLTVSRATELLLLADSHSDSDLKQVVEDFILKHDEEVFTSEKWEELMEVNPRLALKLMHLKYKTKKEDTVFSSSDDSPKKMVPESLFCRTPRKNNSPSTSDSNERYYQKQMHKFQDSGFRNITPESSYCENSDVDMKTQNFVNPSYPYNERQETSEKNRRFEEIYVTIARRQNEISKMYRLQKNFIEEGTSTKANE